MSGVSRGSLAAMAAFCAAVMGCGESPSPPPVTGADDMNAMAPTENVEAPVDPNQTVSIEAMGE